MLLNSPECLPTDTTYMPVVNLQRKENYLLILVEEEGKSINYFATETVAICLKTLLLYRQIY